MTKFHNLDPMIKAILKIDHLSEETSIGYSKRLSLIPMINVRKTPSCLLDDVMQVSALLKSTCSMRQHLFCCIVHWHLVSQLGCFGI